MTYDNSYEPPDWWLEKLEVVMVEQGWTDGEIVAKAREIDGRDPSWGPDRLSKMRSRKSKGTIQLVVALSRAAHIPSPVIEAETPEEADALDRWLATRRPTTIGQSGKPPRVHTVAQALEAAVKDKKDQTDGVPSMDEGIARGRRTRRAPRSRS